MAGHENKDLLSWNDLLHQGQTANVSIIRAKTGTLSIETLDVHLVL
jgi:hypothetical protein